jgi:hypothetical protein
MRVNITVLATTALVLGNASPTPIFAETVLERVLRSIHVPKNYAPQNSVFTNIAESSSSYEPASILTKPFTLADWYPGFDIPGMRDDIPALYRIIGERDGQPGVYHSRWVEANHIGTTIDGNITDFADSFIIGENGSITVSDLNGVSDTYYIVPGAIGCIVSCTPDQIFATITEGGVTYTPFDGTEPIYDNGSNPFILSAMEATHGDVINFHYYDTISRETLQIIDGSVTNVISVTEATAIAGTAGAILVQRGRSWQYCNYRSWGSEYR